MTAIADFDLAVIGGGPAGMTAAIQACRSDLKVVLFEKDRLGGLLLNANLVENYPVGRPGITGLELVDLFQQHLARFEVEVVKDEIKKFERDENGNFNLIGSRSSYSSRTLIIAAGTVPRTLDLPGMNSLKPKRVYYEIRDLYPIPQSKSYAVIGGGDAVFDYSLNLAKYESIITILVRSDTPNCLPLLKKRVEAQTERISVKYNAEAKMVEEDPTSGKLIVKIACKDREEILLVDFLMIAVGREPDFSLIADIISNESVHEGNLLHTKTNIPGLYLAGDLRSGRNRQVGIAVGSGLTAAMMAASHLTSGGHK